MCKSSGGVHREEDRRDLFNLPLYEHHLVIYTCAVQDVNSQNTFPCWTACTKFISERNVACIPVVSSLSTSKLRTVSWWETVMNRIALMCMVSAGLQGSLLVSRGLCWSSLPQYLLSPTFKAGPHTPVSCQLGASTYCRASSKCTFRVFIMCAIITEVDLDRPNGMTKMQLLLVKSQEGDPFGRS